MGFLCDLFFGTTEPVNAGKKKPEDGFWSPLEKDCDEYFQELWDAALSGDLSAQAELQRAFGDDREGEY